MALVKQWKTAGLRPKFKYEYIVPRLSKCFNILTETFLINSFMLS